MIGEALQHCIGVGPVRLARLHDAGVRSWTDVLDYPDRIPAGCRAELVQESRRCLAALESANIQYFVDRFAPKDKWRILTHFLDQTTFFDIETLGLEYDAPITVIVCWHAGQLRTFVEHENLDDFLTLLDQVSLLASFNGSSFDVPRVLDAFHIPALPCAHLDLRWLCYHRGLIGGLKDITIRMGITRPPDLQHANGALAVQLWSAWKDRNDRGAREYLIRYCAADVLLLVAIAERLSGRDEEAPDALWRHLPSAPNPPKLNESTSDARRILGPLFGDGSPTQLRARRTWQVG